MASLKSNNYKSFKTRAARKIAGSKYDAYSKPLIKDLGWKTIEDLINMNCKPLSLNLEMGLLISLFITCLLLTRLILRIIYETLPQT